MAAMAERQHFEPEETAKRMPARLDRDRTVARPRRPALGLRPQGRSSPHQHRAPCGTQPCDRHLAHGGQDVTGKAQLHPGVRSSKAAGRLPPEGKARLPLRPVEQRRQPRIRQPRIGAPRPVQRHRRLAPSVAMPPSRPPSISTPSTPGLIMLRAFVIISWKIPRTAAMGELPY